jgi:hypothetical protein
MFRTRLSSVAWVGDISRLRLDCKVSVGECRHSLCPIPHDLRSDIWILRGRPVSTSATTGAIMESEDPIRPGVFISVQTGASDALPRILADSER